MDSKEQLLKTLEELSKIKQKFDQKILEEISKSAQNTSDPNVQSLVKTGVEFANKLVEGRRSLEQSILNSLKPAGEKTAETTAQGKKEDQTEPQGKTITKVGTILIRVADTSKSVEVPVTISNHDDDSQEVEVDTSYFRNMETGKQAVSKIRADRDKITLGPHSTEKVLIIFELNSKLKAKNKYFTKVILRGKEERMLEVIMEIIAGDGEAASKPEITFSPAS